MKGGILALAFSKAWSLIGTLIVIGAILIAVVGLQSTAALASTTAKVGGQSTGLVFASLPAFFQSIRDGQALVKGGTSDKPSGDSNAKADAKKSDKKGDN